MTQLSASSHSFASIEQLDEVMHAMDWATKYRQLQPGPFSSTFAILEGESWFLMEEHSSRKIEVEAPAPAGMYMLALMEGEPVVINGQFFSADHILVQGPESDLQATVPAGVVVTQVGILAEQFEEAVFAVAPELSWARANAYTIAIAPGRLTSVRQAMKAALLTPASRNAMREEVVSSLLANIAAIAGDQSQTHKNRKIHRQNAQRSMDKAKEYIEAHLDQAIRIAPLCRYSGANLRTLERSFARETGMSPQQYVLARRLNAVRSHLLAADKEQRLKVTEVALSHGFTHLGRFARNYKRHFGEYPRETLCNSQN
jgi:AraC-like DNA-binding protein